MKNVACLQQVSPISMLLVLNSIQMCKTWLVIKQALLVSTMLSFYFVSVVAVLPVIASSKTEFACCCCHCHCAFFFF